VSRQNAVSWDFSGWGKCKSARKEKKPIPGDGVKEKPKKKTSGSHAKMIRRTTKPHSTIVKERRARTAANEAPG